MLNLKGLRTKISAAFAGLPVALATIGVQFDPQMVIDLISGHPVLLAGYQALTYLAAHYYRDQANDEPELTDEEVVAKAEQDLDRLLEPVDELELSIADNAGGDFEYEEPEKN